MSDEFGGDGHVHVIGVCREHGPQDIHVMEDTEKGNKALQNLPSDYLKVGSDVKEIYRTPNSVEFVMQHEHQTESHPIVAFLRVGCPLPFTVCNMMHMMETMSKARQMMLDDPASANKLEQIIEKGRIEREDSLGDGPIDFGSIESFLKQNKNDDNGFEQRPN